MITNGKERERRRDRLTAWEWHVHTAKIDNQYGPTVKKNRINLKNKIILNLKKKRKNA